MMGTKSFIYRFGEFELREGEFSLVKGAEAVPVEPKVFRALLFLLRNPKNLIPKEELVRAVWGDTAVADGSLTRCIWILRRLLGDDFNEPRYIVTIATVGYRLICPVEVLEESQPGPVQQVEPPAPINPVPNGEDKEDKRRRTRLSAWFLPASGSKKVGAWVLTGCVMLALCGAATFWYLHRPLPPLRVTGTNQITHDGHVGFMAGTDGARIYFNFDPFNPPTQTLYFVSTSGGETQKVPLAFGHGVAWDVSRDGSNLLVRSLEPSALWTVDVPGGAAHFITKGENSWGHRWSPDGKYIAYCDGREGQEGLYVMGHDGANVHKLVAGKIKIWELAWSPDGSRIRFSDGGSLWEVSSAGTNLHPLFPKWKGPAGQCCGRWTPDGDFYIFIAGDSVGNSQIWALDERRRLLLSASPDPVPLTSDPIHWGSPTPSNDGNKIFALGWLSRGELVRFDRASQQLRPFLGGISAEFLAYSKDGAQIAYVTYPDGILWRAKADGTERIQLTNPPLYPVFCRWSPDGSQILFAAQRGPDLSRTALYVIPVQGGTPRLLVSGDDGQEQSDGVWSPDGRKVLFNIQPKDSLRILDLGSGSVSEVPGSNGLYLPRWSPDGRYFAAMTMTRSTTDPGFLIAHDTIRLFDLQTQQWSTLAEHRGDWAWPTWSHDGKFLFALNEHAAYRIAVPGGKPQRVVDLKDFRSPDGWFGLDSDDTPLFLRDNGTNDIYALTLDRK